MIFTVIEDMVVNRYDQENSSLALEPNRNSTSFKKRFKNSVLIFTVARLRRTQLYGQASEC